MMLTPAVMPAAQNLWYQVINSPMAMEKLFPSLVKVNFPSVHCCTWVCLPFQLLHWSNRSWPAQTFLNYLEGLAVEFGVVNLLYRRLSLAHTLFFTSHFVHTTQALSLCSELKLRDFWSTLGLCHSRCFLIFHCFRRFPLSSFWRKINSWVPLLRWLYSLFFGVHVSSLCICFVWNAYSCFL